MTTQPHAIETQITDSPTHSPFGTSTAPSFITIAQQIGAECFSLPQRLTEVLSELDPNAVPWSHWDEELVEKVCSDNQIPRELVASLDISGQSWIDDFLHGIAGRADEMTIFFRVKKAVHNLAAGGHVVLIGHGSTYMTHGMPGGVHVRLIAPEAYRIGNVAERFNLTPREAERHMHKIDRQRQRFFAHFWPEHPLAPEMFTAQLNTARLDEQKLSNAIVSMLRQAT